MDQRNNPYSPGAGTPPPELSGRGDVIERANIALDRIRMGRTARSFIFYGLRGVGKTVLLNKIKKDAEISGCASVWIEAPENRSLPALLLPPLRAALIRLSAGQAVRAGLQKALVAVTSFARAMKLKYKDVEVMLDFESKRGIADSGDLENDLIELFGKIGEAAVEKKTAIVLFVDELQYLEKDHLAALIIALHRSSQDQMPVTMVAAGLPQLISQMGKAKSYAERLFEFVNIGSLDEASAKSAICIPAEKEGVRYDARAVDEIIAQTKGYPYFLQEWGKHSWNIAKGNTVKLQDVKAATDAVIAELDSSFFRVRFDRLTPKEKRYVRAMAELGHGPYRSGAIADLLKKEVTAVAPLRNNLVSKGMIYSSAHGDTDFTVPLFDAFLKRIMPRFE